MELRIQQLRKRKGVTQVELAHACETTQQQIAKIESGLIDLKISTLQKIAKALDCEIHNLFYTKEEFLNDVLAVIKNQKVDLKKVLLVREDYFQQPHQLHLKHRHQPILQSRRGLYQLVFFPEAYLSFQIFWF